MTFSLPATSCLLKLPTDTDLRTANWSRLNMANHMTRHRRSALYGASIMGAYFLLIFNAHISFQSTFDNWHSSLSPTTFFWNSCTPQWCMCIDTLHQTIFSMLSTCHWDCYRSYYRSTLSASNPRGIRSHWNFSGLSCHINKRMITNWQFHHTRLHDGQGRVRNGEID